MSHQPHQSYLSYQPHPPTYLFIMDTSLFNAPQLQAIEYCDGPSLVIAGAGSGKTRVLTHKIAYLIEQGYEPWSILALTFTNKAADEMKERIGQIVGRDVARHLWMGTFHSVFLRILRTEYDKIGLQPNFTIYDAADSKSLVKSIIKELKLDDKTYKPSAVLNRIGAAKNQLITAKQYAADAHIIESDCRSKMPELHKVYTQYSNRCRSANAMDFDDILLYTYYLFKVYPEVKAKYEERFRYVLVDEYQDTNNAQHQIILQLTQQRQRVCVVGDDAQSIYSFRGARIDNILTFQSVYPSTRVFKLEQNYRSTQTIVNAANSLIHKNQGQIYKEVYSKRDIGDKIELTEAYSDVEEAQIVIRKIQWLHSREHLNYSDLAILYRTNAQSRLFEEHMRKQSIPYKIYGGLSFYQRKEIKDVISYFRMAVNPNDEEALKRIINYPARGIGNTTLAKVIACANDNNVSPWTVIASPTAYSLDINAGTGNKIQQFCTLIQSFIDKASTDNAEQAGRFIIENCGIIADIYQDKEPENLSRQENVEELLNGLTDFCDSRLEEDNNNISLSDYLNEVSLVGASESETTDSNGEDSDDKVRLMTIHSAKGLEFPVVFIVGMEEGLFPNEMCSGNTREIEEERRLFYVAITRAMQQLFITYAKSRLHFGKMEFGEPSRFLCDIDSQYLSTRGNRQHTSSYGERSDPTTGRARMASLFGTRPAASRTSSTSSATSGPTFSAPSRSGSSHTGASSSLPLGGSFRKVADTRRTPSSTPPSSSASSASQPSVHSGLRPGQQIRHDRFGFGTVVSLEGEGDSMKAVVQFENSGTKQLLLKFARFTVVG